MIFETNFPINCLMIEMVSKQITRVNEMTKERMRQLMRGERSLSNYHDKVKPPRDAWQMGPFHP